MSWTKSELVEVMGKLIKRSGNDPEFRALCITQPREAIEQISAKQVPEDLKVQFVDNANCDITLILPDIKAEEELSDSELEHVAGGVSFGDLGSNLGGEIGEYLGEEYVGGYFGGSIGRKIGSGIGEDLGSKLD